MSVFLFVGDMSESKAQQVEIREVDGQTLRNLVDYIYTAEIEVTEDNVQVRARTGTGSENVFLQNSQQDINNLRPHAAFPTILCVLCLSAALLCWRSQFSSLEVILYIKITQINLGVTTQWDNRYR